MTSTLHIIKDDIEKESYRWKLNLGYSLYIASEHTFKYVKYTVRSAKRNAKLLGVYITDCEYNEPNYHTKLKIKYLND